MVFRRRRQMVASLIPDGVTVTVLSSDGDG
jgi:hypothetical protein